MAAMHVARNPTPSLAELPGLLPMGLILTCPPGLAYVFLVRSWLGSLLAGTGFVALCIWFLRWLSIESEKSSTAGIAILELPFLLMAPILAVFLWEQFTWNTKAPKPLPPPPVASL
jgi:hypothetical protein